MPDSFDLIVIGAGPGGYVAAIRAAQLGMKVASIDREDALGGTCVRVGCIPSKALLESSHHFEQAKGGGLRAHGVGLGPVTLDLGTMLGRKNEIVAQLTSGVAHLFRKNGIERVHGHGRLCGGGRVEVAAPDGSRREIAAKNILIATGSEPSSLPGVELDGDRIGCSTEALSYAQVPKHLIVVGAGVIGLELGSVWRRLGAEVTLLEYVPRLLPTVDEEVGKMAERLFRRQGLAFELGVRVTGARVDGDLAHVTFERADSKHELVADRVLVATGRRPNTDGLDVEAAGVRLDGRGRIEVDERLETAANGVWAIGDVISGPMLAHKAEEEGIAAVERMAGLSGHVNYDAIPSIIYTHPEIATIGRTEQELREAQTPFRKGSFPFKANGRAKALGDTDGFVKILSHSDTDRLLGVHIIGPQASELAAEAAVAMEFAASAEDLARSVHAHPTLSEVVKEAALSAGGRVIHL